MSNEPELTPQLLRDFAKLYEGEQRVLTCAVGHFPLATIMRDHADLKEKQDERDAAAVIYACCWMKRHLFPDDTGGILASTMELAVLEYEE